MACRWRRGGSGGSYHWRRDLLRYSLGGIGRACIVGTRPAGGSRRVSHRVGARFHRRSRTRCHHRAALLPRQLSVRSRHRARRPVRPAQSAIREPDAGCLRGRAKLRRPRVASLEQPPADSVGNRRGAATPCYPNIMKLTTSERLLERACKIIPGGVNSPVRAFRSVGGTPPFIVRGEGSRIHDADGNSYIDYVGSWGPLLLGHRHPAVIAALERVLAIGTSFGAPTEREIEMAEKICAAMPSMEMMRLVNSGTEATMSALRVARGFTGR